MKAQIWNRIAAWLVKDTERVELLIARAKHRPYTHVYNDDGTLYMERWTLLQGPSWFPFHVRVHHLVTADQDRPLHDHPFDYRTIILRGTYVEQDAFGVLYFRCTGYTASSRAETFHRIDAVEKGTYSLFIAGPRKGREWGFIENDRKVRWYDFLRGRQPAAKTDEPDFVSASTIARD